MDMIQKLCKISRRRADAVASVTGSEKYPAIHGFVFFYRLPDAVLVRAEITGLPRNQDLCRSPFFAFHIHEGGACTGTEEDLFADAGSHFNPNGCEHPYHAGDMPPLLGVNGNAFSLFLTDRFRIPQIIGKTVIIHAHPDDFMTQRSGNSGEKIACGIITAHA